jgi:hypothetical protein
MGMEDGHLDIVAMTEGADGKVEGLAVRIRKIVR